MNDYSYKSAQSVDAATAKQEVASPLWDAVQTFCTFSVPLGQEAPKEYQELVSDRSKYRVLKEQVEFRVDTAVIAVWYIKKVGETPRKEKAAVKGFADKNPEATKFSTQT